MSAKFTSTDDIVRDGLCIGCGLCAAVTGPEKIQMNWTQEGRLRPIEQSKPSPAHLAEIQSTCPGLVSAGLTKNEAANGAECDTVWGYLSDCFITWAGDKRVRYESSTGGTLNALAIHLLERGDVKFILHLGPHPQFPARSKCRISTTYDEIIGSCGSRYGPSAPLEGLEEALARNQPFAFVGKPCDVSAMRLRAQQDARIAKLCKYRLALVCGGTSEFGKTQTLLEGWNVNEDDVAMLRYRGNGNPGPTRVITNDGQRFETTYNNLWEDESTWQLQHRCKICPDAIGEAADIIAMDCWPGGSPTAEDDGFNALCTRSDKGNALVVSALQSGALVRGDTVSVNDLNDFQPHQVRKKKAVWARLAGHRAAGLRTIDTTNLRIESLARHQPFRALLHQARGTKQRAQQGRISEPTPTLVKD
jgi:coenzyme F420 hydrogenase subunit beta